MARIAGIDLPRNKRGVIGLTYIFGIGKSRAKEILERAQVDENKKVNDWTDDEINSIRETVATFKIEGELRSEDSIEYQTVNGYWLLQRDSSQKRIAFARSTH